jgi:hypothetical protein
MVAGTREIEGICDPARHSCTEAIAAVRILARQVPSMYLEVARFLQQKCAGEHPDLDTICRTLEVLVEITPACALTVVLRPVLRESAPKLRSKCILILAQHEKDLGWAEKLMADDDGRVRASVIEGMWGMTSPEAERLFLRAAFDSHHRVAANAVYGFYLLDPDKAIPMLEKLIASERPESRSAAAWVIRKIGSAELKGMLKPLILDKTPAVRHAGFQALQALRT